MYGGGKKTQWEDDGKMAETFEIAPHGYQKGRRRGLSLDTTTAVVKSLGVNTATSTAAGSMHDKARINLYRNAFPSYERFNSYNTVFNLGYNRNYLKLTPHPKDGPPKFVYGKYIFKNPDFYPSIQTLYQWCQACPEKSKKVGYLDLLTMGDDQDAWNIVFTKGRANFAQYDTWYLEETELPSVGEDGYELSHHYKIGADFDIKHIDTALIDQSIRSEYVYIGVRTINLAPVDDQPKVNRWQRGSNNTYEDSILHIYADKYHMQYALFGEESVSIGPDDPGGGDEQGLFANYLSDQTFKDPASGVFKKLSPADYTFSQSDRWQQTWDRLAETGAWPLFELQKLYINLDFVVHHPYSPAMANAAGLTDNYLMVASIESEYEFVPSGYVETLEDNNVHENVLPNFYSFLSLLNSKPNNVAPKDLVFNEEWGDTSMGGHNDQLTLGGLIDPNQIPLIGKDYMDYQQFSQLPPGHSNWFYDNNKAVDEPYNDITHFDYWAAWQQKYLEVANMQNEMLWLTIIQRNKNIVFPYESINYLNDFNDKISMFPCHTRIQWPRGSKPVIPKLLKQAKADKYVMRAIIGAAVGTGVKDSQQDYGDGKLVSSRDSATFKVHIEHPAGEKSSGDYIMFPANVGIGYKESPTPANLFNKYNDLTLAPDPIDMKIPDDQKDSYGTLSNSSMWDLSDILNGFKAGSEQPWLSTQTFEEMDNEQTNYIGVDQDSGWPFNDDLSVGNPSVSFTKSIYATILEKQLQNFGIKKLKSYGQSMSGDSCYSEIIMFRIEKLHFTGPNEQQAEFVQNIWMWNTGELENLTYLDTQVVPGRKYGYKIFAYHLVVGSEYAYIDSNQRFPDLMADKYVKELGIKNRPCFKIVEIPWFGFEELSQLETMIVDAPPVPPDPSFIPYKNVADKVNITIKTNSGEFSTNKLTSLLPGDEKLWQDILKSQNELSDGVVTFKSDTLPASYEVFRIGPDPLTGQTKPPVSYNSFAADEPYKIITVDGSSQTFDDDVEPNTTYYYTFRSRDPGTPGFISNPTSVFKLEMIQEAGKNVVFPVITVYEMKKSNAYKSASKTMKRFLHIKPAYENTLVDEEASGYLDQDSAKMSEPGYSGEGEYKIPKLGLNQDNYEMFHYKSYDSSKFDDNGKSKANRFKIRLTSKKSGRKIDINVGFLHKHNE